jgi:DNA-binding NarL/FixJ family response regulator
MGVPGVRSGCRLGVRAQAVDFTPLLEQLRQRPGQITAALEGATLVLAAGSRTLLSAWNGVLLQAPKQVTVVGAATTAAEALDLTRRHQPTLLLCTDRLEQGDGIGLVEAVKRECLASRTLLVVTDERRQSGLQRAIAAACDGICLDSRVGEGTLLAAVHSILAGGTYRDRQREQPADSGGVPRPLTPLSTRELEVLERLQQGLSNRQIADALYLSPDTIKSHVRSLLQKLAARDRGHAAVIGLQLGLIDWREP